MWRKAINAHLLIFASWATIASADEVDLTERLVRSNELFLTSEVVRPYLDDPATSQRLSRWLNHPKIQNYVVDCQFHLRAFFRAEKIIGPLCYFLRQDAPERRRLYFPLVKRYIYEVGAALAELADDPRYSAADRGRAKEWAMFFKQDHFQAIQRCFEPAMNARYNPDGTLPYTPFSAVGRCFHESVPKIGNLPYFAVNLAKEFRNHPGHAISPTGWIAGNKLRYFYWNDTSEAIRDLLEREHHQMRSLYPLSGAGSFESMRTKNPDEIFTETQGFLAIESHALWREQREGAIFPAIKAAIDRAQETVFIDIFFLGSSMGVSLAKHLTKVAERGVKIFVLRDNYNHFGHEAEMRPVFNFLMSYAQRYPERMVISGSWIKSHTSGLPKVMESVLTDEFLTKSGLQSHLALYGRAQSDHSKVFVIDGTSRNPIALVGSKNITDASGGITIDELVQVEGPAAAVVLDDFYYDMAYALKFELPPATLQHFAQNGWSKNLYRQGQSREEQVANILKPFDLLGRDHRGIPSARANVRVSAVGTSLARTGMNNVNSTRTNCVDQVIQLILSAKRNIYIKDQYLFDRNVVLALVRAKKARPDLQIKVLLEPMERANPQGLPNLLYLDILVQNGIEVRWKKLVEPGQHIHSEYHMKTISADGQSVISGSANKDQTTMYGSFREQQLDIWDAEVTRVHDQVFAQHWSDSESRKFTGYNFEVPYNLKGIDGEPMQAGEFVALLRNVVSIVFDAQQL